MPRFTQDCLKVAVGLIFNPAAAQILVALRPNHCVQGGLWEFPGGKFEKNETPFEALKRELWEETGITLLQARLFIKVRYPYAGNKIELYALQVTDYKGVPFGREGQQVRWVDAAELTQLNFPEGNKQIVNKITPFFNSVLSKS